MKAEVAVIGGGMGGVAAALAAARGGATVVLTEQTEWLGGQLTSQLVPLDDHLFIETTGANASYRRLRAHLRDHYRRDFPLAPRALRDPHLNPGACWVSPVGVDPRVAVSVLDAELLPHVVSGRVTVLRGCRPVRAEAEADVIRAVEVEDAEGERVLVRARYFLDATELGDLLELGAVEFVSGRESREQTGEPNAAETADPTDMQSVTWCFAIDHLEGEDHTIDRPEGYEHFRDVAPPHRNGVPALDFRAGINSDGSARRVYRLDVNPDDDPSAVDLDHRHMGRTPDLWTYRRIAARRQFRDGYLRSDITVVNWPMNDYVGGPLFGVDDAEEHWRGAKQLSASLLYWLQTEAPRPDGGTGWPGLRLRADVAGTKDGFAMMPYIRESRRIRARRTIVEQDVSVALRGDRGAVRYEDTVGTGHYFWIDRHPSTRGSVWPGGIPHPFEIPLGALVPVRMRNVVAAGKNIGTTQITNGCYRLHPVEWSVGEAAGALAAFCVERGTEPHAVADGGALLQDFQRVLAVDGVQLRWPEGMLWSADEELRILAEGER